MFTTKTIAEGKTKVIRSTPWPDAFLMESTDYITAGDGIKRHVLENKGVLATKTTRDCFVLLEANGIPTHFIGTFDRRTLIVRKVEMIPVEFVARRIAFGSYLKRNPETAEGTIFDEIVFESFFKDDALHDPFIYWWPEGCSIAELCFMPEKIHFGLFNPKKPLSEGYIRDLKPQDARVLEALIGGIFKRITCDVFRILEQAWAKLGVTLVDLKIECGWTQSGELVVADVIDNDSWRIWPGGDKSQMKDKQVYRDAKEVDLEKLRTLYENYCWVAEQTKRFLTD